MVVNTKTRKKKESLRDFGLVRIATVTMPLEVGNPDFNSDEIVAAMKRADEKDVQILVTPELSLTAYTCADLFHQTELLEGAQTGLAKVIEQSRKVNGLVIVGMPILADRNLFNCAVAIKRGRIIGAVPKAYLPGYKEFYEPRWFSPAGVPHPATIKLLGQTVPFGNDLLMRASDCPELVLFIEICEDLWVKIPPSSLASLAGATVFANCSASNALIGKADYRRSLVMVQSARCGIYAYSAAGIDESTTDVVFDGHMLIAENGSILKENERFEDKMTMLVAEVDLQRVVHDAMKSNSDAENKRQFAPMLNFRTVEFTLDDQPAPGVTKELLGPDALDMIGDAVNWQLHVGSGTTGKFVSIREFAKTAKPFPYLSAGEESHPVLPTLRYRLRRNPQLNRLERFIDPHPFVPAANAELNRRCAEIFNITRCGLRKRLKSLAKRLGKKEEKVVIGVSGGLDSTLALLKVVRVYDQLGWSRSLIHGYTMPGFGTTGRTKGNSHALMRLLGITAHEVDIRAMCFAQWLEEGYNPFGIDLKEIVKGVRSKYFAAIREGAEYDVDVDFTALAVVEFNERLKDLPDGAQDLKFENTQARMRTKILMDNGFVIGTGDLSEIALGWSTYNGDHMSMYNVNCSIPKTLIKFLVSWASDNFFDGETRAVLKDIVATKISPELLPTGRDGEVKQVTEDTVGPYELHDFFLYYMLRWGMGPEKILYLATHAKFDGGYSEATIARWLKAFIRRFFMAQFKRTAIPDGPKVGSISLSPRGDWRMPTDADMSLWLEWADATELTSGNGATKVTTATTATPADDKAKKFADTAKAVAEALKLQCFGNLPLAVTPTEGINPAEWAFGSVDAINAFGSKEHGGELPVPEGEQIAEPTNRALKSKRYGYKFAGNDQHPADMANFADNAPAGATTVLDRDGLPMAVWPRHAEKNTWGAEFFPGIDSSLFDAIYPKGTDKDKDSNSACGNADLIPALKERGIKYVDLDGLVFRICVGLTAIDLAKAGFKVRVIVDATRDLDLPDFEWVIEQMVILGVQFVTLDQVLAER